MFEWLASPEAWIALGTLTALEIVLGIDNIIFISILVGRLPADQREFARKTGLGLAMIARLGLKGKLWLAMGILLVSLLVASAWTITEVRGIVGSVDKIKSSSAPTAVTSANLMLLSGQAVGFAINSGRIAGENAAKYVQSRAV